MDYKLIKEKLAARLPADKIIEDCPMAKHTTFRCGGNAALFVEAGSLEELQYAISVLKAFGADWFVLGNGSNVLFKDGGYDGVVIRLGKEFSEITFDGCEVVAGAAAMLPYLSKVAGARSFSGLEFACGIPGSVGGAVFMNAGAYGGTVADCIKNVVALTRDGELYQYDRDELELYYRHSRFMNSGEIILFAKFELHPGNQDDINAVMEANNTARKTKQPINYPSAGSFFKRPEGHYAGALIEQAGLKGCRIGGAEVSRLHAGFIINADNATAGDVLALCEHVQNEVEKMSGVRLEPEVRFIGN